jgi:hypothetical protein
MADANEEKAFHETRSGNEKYVSINNTAIIAHPFLYADRSPLPQGQSPGRNGAIVSFSSSGKNGRLGLSTEIKKRENQAVHHQYLYGHHDQV